tara:strand:+ start:193 stop:864 length:672 start_codon:yes stop_codon:yes gene_type:complete
MSLLSEVTHIISPLSVRAFDSFVEIYGELAVPAMERHGYEVLGGWKWSSGRIGNSLMLIRFESQTERQKAEDSLLGDTVLINKLRQKLEKAGVLVREEIKFATPLPNATEERLRLAFELSNIKTPRQFWLTRSLIALGKSGLVHDLLNESADQAESASNGKLVHAYQTLVGKRGEISHLWASPKRELDYSVSRSEPSALASLKENIAEEELILLNALPFSKLQ